MADVDEILGSGEAAASEISELSSDEKLKLEATIRKTVVTWFREKIHGSAVSRCTPAINHLMKSLDDLTERIVKAVS